MALGFIQPPTEMSTRNIKIKMFLESKVRRVRRADNLATRPPLPVTGISLMVHASWDSSWNIYWKAYWGWEIVWCSWLRHYTIQAGRSRVRFPMMSLNSLNCPNPCSRAMALGFTQPLTEMIIRRCLWGSKAHPARKSDSLTTMCEPIV
jgi:hypothetical protein